MGRIREDIHIHASASDTFARLEATASYGEWLPHCFREIEVSANGSGLDCLLSLPLRSERVRLRPDETDEPRLLLFRAAAGGSAFETLSWVLSPEGQNDTHLLVEAIYTPAGGFAGVVLDVLLQRAHRRQALRDAVWRLKHVLEGNAPQPAGEAEGA